MKKKIIIISGIVLVIALVIITVNLLIHNGAGTFMNNIASSDGVMLENCYTMDSTPKTEVAEQMTRSGLDIIYTDQATAQPKNTNIKKVIKDASVSIEVKEIDKDFEKITKWVEQNNGYEFSRNIYHNGKYKHINVVFKVQPEKLNAFIEFLNTTGKLRDSRINSNDITEQYYDTATRLENLKKGREQFIKIQEKAVKIEDILKVQNELNRITGEIEALQGKINMWDNLIAESTVTISISEEADPIKITQELNWKISSFSDILKTMKNGFIWTTNALVNIFIWIIIAVVAILPVIAIGVIIVVVIKLIKKRKNK